ncbi:MAG: dephospho-CoA kinase [Polyangiales bacterium]
MKIFGLTGGIASGKTTVAKILEREGVPVIDADQLARDVVAPGSPGLAAVVEAFGDVLLPNGELDRKKVGALIFADPDRRMRLNAIVHPLVAQASASRMQKLEAEGHPFACYDAALLVERGLADAFRPLVVVAAPRELQRARLMQRDGLSEADADARLDAQAPVEMKIAVADHVLWNDADLATLEARTLEILKEVRASKA